MAACTSTSCTYISHETTVKAQCQNCTVLVFVHATILCKLYFDRTTYSTAAKCTDQHNMHTATKFESVQVYTLELRATLQARNHMDVVHRNLPATEAYRTCCSEVLMIEHPTLRGSWHTDNTGTRLPKKQTWNI